MGLFKSKLSFIICEYENNNTTQPIKIINICKDNKEEIPKLKIFYINKKKERLQIKLDNNKYVSNEKNIKIIIINDKSINNIKKLFKGCSYLKTVDFQNFDFSNIKSENEVKELFYNCEILKKSDKLQETFKNHNLDFNNIYTNDSSTNNENENERQIKIYSNFNLNSNNQNVPNNRNSSEHSSIRVVSLSNNEEENKTNSYLILNNNMNNQNTPNETDNEDINGFNPNNPIHNFYDPENQEDRNRLRQSVDNRIRNNLVYSY